MSKWNKIVSGVFAAFLLVTFLHVWLNIGFDKIPLANFLYGSPKEATFRVGFLPVT